MKDAKKGRGHKTRRQFLHSTALIGASAVATSACFPDVGGRWPKRLQSCQPIDPLDIVATDSPVFAIHNSDSVLAIAASEQSGEQARVEINADVVNSMMSSLLTECAGTATAPWQQLLPHIDSHSHVGIKVNCLNARCPTSIAVVKSIIAGLQTDLGLDGENIIVWDRRLDELQACGFEESDLGVRVIGTINSTSDLKGPGYEVDYCEIVNGKITHLSRILTRMTDVTINVPVLKTHGVSGVTAALKNIYGVIDNPGDFHRDLVEAMPRIYALAPIRESFAFTVLDALVAVTVGGTSDDADTLARRLVVAADALALDRYALDLANQLRSEKSPAIGPVSSTVTRWLDVGHEIGIGAKRYQLRDLTQT